MAHLKTKHPVQYVAYLEKTGEAIKEKVSIQIHLNCWPKVIEFAWNVNIRYLNSLELLVKIIEFAWNVNMKNLNSLELLAKIIEFALNVNMKYLIPLINIRTRLEC